MPPFTEEVLQKRVQKKQEAAQIRQFKSQQKVFLMTSRFNTQTKLENQRFREKNWKQGCLYCSPTEISQAIPFKAKLLVLEMDNDTNQIFAIGMCANRALTQKYAVYETTNYATFTKWPIYMLVADTLWGGLLFAITAKIYYSIYV